MSWLRPMSAWLHTTARHSREHRTRAQQQARTDRATAEHVKVCAACADGKPCCE
jgi:hypothetical protein